MHHSMHNGSTARSFRFTHVRSFPAKLIEDFADKVFRRFAVAANEHRRFATLKLRIDHARAAN